MRVNPQRDTAEVPRAFGNFGHVPQGAQILQHLQRRGGQLQLIVAVLQMTPQGVGVTLSPTVILWERKD